VKAIAFAPGTTTLHLVERPGPSITAPEEVRLRVLRLGVCGMDCDEIEAGLDWKKWVTNCGWQIQKLAILRTVAPGTRFYGWSLIQRKGPRVGLWEISLGVRKIISMRLFKHRLEGNNDQLISQKSNL